MIGLYNTRKGCREAAFFYFYQLVEKMMQYIMNTVHEWRIFLMDSDAERRKANVRTAK